MMEFFMEILSSFIYFGDDSLHTKKIDRNIKSLKRNKWFNDLYEDENYHRLFFVNKRVRKFLQSNFRVKRLVKRKKNQKKFLMFLNEQLKRSEQSG
ncbi:hypothetical protein SRABI96_04442 [Peribacillus sp. Bi96]|nr:hypothetical protein SRABI96_04442 [Peribacillus sp. Bi96]